jgi:hypothetical protein
MVEEEARMGLAHLESLNVDRICKANLDCAESEGMTGVFLDAILVVRALLFFFWRI